MVTGSAMLGGGEGLTVGEVELVAGGFVFTEGPVWLPEGVLLFSDIPAGKIYRADKTVFREPSGQSNGLTLDTQGRLLAAEHQTRRVTRTEKDGTVTVLAERFEGKRLNSPNDLVVRSDGTVFFTDPPYGLPRGLQDPAAELAFSGVYAIAPDGTLKALVKDFNRPNGLAFSPGEEILYVADTAEGHLRAFDVAGDGALSASRVLCELPGPDGMKVDTQGNVWSTAGDGVRVIAPDGALLATVKFPAQPANCAFGGEDAKTLYATARQAVYKVRLSIPGIKPGGQGNRI